ncbi:virion structural protein [Erwinia phage vB_EamM_ChrisDB]|uniref:virion structural protein n=1 Tax=Erwinia phage vB_EamM_ChrisDB TaxID=1883371 RepID=UPI00081C86D4|nr:virion structural protein [Erwinia phage vB_EamM_ChrisDB]ANZ48727.1 putative virion structural protein [Erwinia phage vB_EamM_ChrisDB]
MGLYTEPSMELLCQQVVRDNPELAGRITAGSIGVRGVPTAKTINGRNTQITLVGKPGKGFAGEITVYYDRLALTNLYNAPLTLYVPKEKTKVADLLPLLRDYYGIALDINEITVPSQNIKPLATLMPLVITASNSPCYTGTLTVNYAAQPYGYFPDSGPGSKQLLAGDEVYGYFGVVEQKDFATATDLYTTAFPGVDKSTIEQTNFTWRKFFMNGNVVYLPSGKVGTTSWAGLYAAGAVYGDDTTGTPPSGTTPVVQTLYYSKTENGNTSYFNLRIPSDGGRGEDVPLGLLARLGNGNDAGVWGKDTEIRYTEQVIFSALSGAKNLVGNLIGSGGAWIDTWTSSGWFPIVEMLDKSNMVLPLADIEGEVVWACRPLVPTHNDVPETIHPLEIQSATTPLPIPVSVSSKQGTPLMHPIQLQEPTVDIVRPIVAGARTYYVAIPIQLQEPHVIAPRPLVATRGEPLMKYDIATASGELDGFQ